MITLHHFTHPIWFENAGSFTKAENIKWFVEFSEYVFKEFSPKIKLWCTFNELSVLLTAGYFGVSIFLIQGSKIIIKKRFMHQEKQTHN
jgi:beta-glucosidase/6-phospho-beta-glucosidase/beta-galactosidase